VLTKLRIRNFKQFDDVEFELDNPVVFVGPNNSGKTSAMQALALWNLGLGRWIEKFGGKPTPRRRLGVAINRRDLLAAPVPRARELWRQLHIRDVAMTDGKQQTTNVCIEITVAGETNGKEWSCGLEFDYVNEESFYCRPLRLESGPSPERMAIPDQASSVTAALLPPMSGLAETEDLLQSGAIDVRIGQGRTAEVLRNLCYRIYENRSDAWLTLADQIERLFGMRIEPPVFVPARGQIVMTYEQNGVSLDLSAGGRGFQQTLLLLAFMYNNPGAILLIDEPDAHLEILRQRETYSHITEMARENDNQIVIATHSEVVLNEAAGKDTVIAFVGKPHRITHQTGPVLNALREIGWEDYYLAEQTGWTMYLEGSTDLEMLRALARRLKHEEAADALRRPFVQYVANNANAARRHFYALREATPGLAGIALFDRLEEGIPEVSPIKCLMWRRREIENYVCTERALIDFARFSAEQISEGPLFARQVADDREEAMRAAIAEVSAALQTLENLSPWSDDVKASDQVLVPVFRSYATKLDIFNEMAKKNFHQLVDHVPDDELDREIREKLDAIATIASQAKSGN